MDRRSFVKVVSTVAAGLAIPTFSSSEALAGTVPDLVVVKGKDYARSVEKAVEALGGIGHFVKSGDKVLIKPNVGWARTMEQGANTHPIIVATLIRMCKDAGASKVVVADRTCHDPAECFEKSGILAAAKKAGAEVYYEDLKYTNRAFSGVLIKEWDLMDHYLEADKVFNVPVVKHHGLSTMTGAMKNWFGVVGRKRALLHGKIDTTIVDLAATCVPSLTVVDATRVLLRNGPSGGSVDDVETRDLIAAAYDQVAADGWACGQLGLKWTDLGYLKEALERGVGQPDISKLQVLELVS